jgi:hypothetical protein
MRADEVRGRGREDEADREPVTSASGKPSADAFAADGADPEMVGKQGVASRQDRPTPLRISARGSTTRPNAGKAAA